MISAVRTSFALLCVLGLVNNLILFSKPEGSDLVSFSIVIFGTLAFLALTVVHVILLTLLYMRKKFQTNMVLYLFFLIVNLILFLSPGILGVLQK